MFPDDSAELTHILVVRYSNVSKSWYETILGATIHGEYGTSVILKSLNNWILLVERGGPTKDKPDVTMQNLNNDSVVDHSFTIRVKDCERTYDELASRGAQFLTNPVSYEYEMRAFFRDPDGHLYEISQRLQ